MKHRDVLLGLAAAAAGWRAGAQEAPKSAHIGFIVTGAFPRRWLDEAIRAVRLDRGTQSQRRTPGGPRGQGAGRAVPAPAALIACKSEPAAVRLRVTGEPSGTRNEDRGQGER
jgi:hypothetical protein